MRYVILGAALTMALSAAPAAAKCDLDGNCYTATDDGMGGARVRGYNLNTGSSWNTKIDESGNQRGTDSNGNAWRYDNSSGRYYNFGTGQTCTGRGANRTCY